MITYGRGGERKIELWLPFTFQGREVESVTFQPVKFDQTLRWSAGQYESALALMVELSGLEEPVIRSIRYPDIDRVMAVFVDMLPREIRDTIGQRPAGAEPAVQPEPAPAPEPATAEVVDLPPDLEARQLDEAALVSRATESEAWWREREEQDRAMRDRVVASEKDPLGLGVDMNV